MIINFSNHPSEHWEANQHKMAIINYSSVIDVDFPAINPGASEKELDKLVDEYIKILLKILSKSVDPKNAVHIMGEMTFSFRLINKLKKMGILCIASTTTRKVDQNGNIKTTTFEFVRFREY